MPTPYESAVRIILHAEESARTYTPSQVKEYLSFKRFPGAEVSMEHLSPYPQWRLVTVNSSLLVPKEHWKGDETRTRNSLEYIDEYAALDSLDAPPVVATKRGKISALSSGGTEGKLTVIEGHHRTVAAQRSKSPIRAFVPSSDWPI
jgi:hypothetical protein